MAERAEQGNAVDAFGPEPVRISDARVGLGTTDCGRWALLSSNNPSCGTTTMLTAVVQTMLIDRILHEWRSLPAQQQLWGVWIREYRPVVDAAEGVNVSSLPIAAWFADGHGVHKRSVWAWQRLAAVHFHSPWRSRLFQTEMSGPFGRQYELGLAAFAPLTDRPAVYIETVWGGLNGQGWLFELDEEQPSDTSRKVWVA
jgi:hypothetical protein